MLVSKIKMENNQYKNTPNFNGKLLGDGFNIVHTGYIDKVGKEINSFVKNTDCDIIILQNKRTGIIKIIAQKANEFNKFWSKKVEKTVLAKDITKPEMYIQYSKEVIAEYERPTKLQRILMKIKNLQSKTNTNNNQ